MQKFDLQRESYGSIPTKKTHETSINSQKTMILYQDSQRFLRKMTIEFRFGTIT